METTIEAPSEDGPELTAAAERVMVIGGRTFRQSRVTTIDRDSYVIKRYRVSGLAAFSRTFEPAIHDLNEFAEKLLWEAYESGVLYEILAGVLVEDGVRWTRKVAEANAAFFANLTDPADKNAIAERSGDVLFDFLVIADASRKISLSTSGAMAERIGQTHAKDELHGEPSGASAATVPGEHR